MTDDVEIEVKFSLDGLKRLAHVQAWKALGSDYALADAGHVVNVDTYFDTADYALLRRGQTLRLRQHDDELFATTKSIALKSPKGVHGRTEVERPVEDVDVHADMETLAPTQLPADVADALRPLLREDAALRPLCRLHQLRAKRWVQRLPVERTQGAQAGPPDGALAEFSADEVWVLKPVQVEGGGEGRTDSKPDGETTVWQHVAKFYEAEIELLDGGDRDELKALAVEVGRCPGMKANDQNKLQQALEAIADQEPDGGGLHARMHTAELCRRAWRQQLAQMLLNEAGVRDSDDIEYVHDMRVATRRARAAARLYAGFFDRKDKAVRRFTDALRKTGRLLGAVRDLDVAIEKLEDFEGKREDRAGADVLAERWRAQRAKAHAELVAWLDSGLYRKFVVRLADFCATAGAGVRKPRLKAGEAPERFQIRHTIPSLIFDRYETVRAFEVHFERPEPIPAETLHALRIECKYMRYHLEFNSTLLGAPGAELIQALKALQEHLGDLNDAAVSGKMLAEVRREIDTPDIADYQQVQAETFDTLRTQLPGDLAQFLALETRQKLALAVAGI